MAESKIHQDFKGFGECEMVTDSSFPIPFREILDNFPVAIYTTDAKGILTYYNEAAVKFSGRVPQLGSDHWCVTWKLYHADGTPLPHDQCPMAIALKEGRPILGVEAIAEQPCGKRTWFTPYPVPLLDPDGNVTGGFNMLFDISEKKSRLHTDSLLRAIIESSDDAIISKNLDGIITSWNDSAERLFGYSAEEIIGKSITILIPEERLKEESMLLAEIRRGKRTDHFETIRLKKEGTPVDVSLTVSPIYDTGGQVVGASKIARDITERKESEANLRSMNESLEARVRERTSALLSYQTQLKSLTSELSKAEESERQRLATELHDNLGQILAISKIKLDLMMREKLPDRAFEEATQISDLMDNAISFTRDLMSELKPPPTLEKESLAANIGWVASKMNKHNLNVTIFDDDQPKTLSEEARRTVYQCVRELLFNVIKHADVSDARIKLSRVENQLEVVVEDDGKGFIVRKQRPSPTNNGGFGLFNIHERMDWLGGRMEISSKPGKGTVVKLYVPVLEDDETDNQNEWIGDDVLVPPLPLEENQSDKRVTVLIVDDHQMVRAGLKNLIEEQKDLIVIGEATNGLEAVEMARNTNPEVIVMDVNMPEMDGIEATRIITSVKPNIRVIGLSLHEKDEVIEAMRRAGASAYLTKTDAFESLSAVIRSEAMIARKTAVL